MIDYIVNNKEYPNWLSNHIIFQKLNKIDKIFPKIGLPNFREPYDIINSEEAFTEALTLGRTFSHQLQDTKTELFNKLDLELKSNDINRNEKCCKLQSLIDLLSKVIYSLGYNDYAKVIEGKVVLCLRSDIFNGDKNPTFRKNEGLFRVVNKLWDMCSEYNISPTKIDQLTEFKNFSRVNVPNKKYNIVFSSVGEIGSYDIATMSMRGISSCQSWDATQSKALIGSISSKFVGIIYVESDQKFDYGSKMLNRSIVKYVIDRDKKKPILLIDKMYANKNSDTIELFKKILKEKSGLETYYSEEINNKTSFYTPYETSEQYLLTNEFSYPDTVISTKKELFSVKTIKLNPFVEKLKNDIFEQINTDLRIKKEIFLEKKDDPKIEPELANFFNGGMLNLFLHCDRYYGENSSAKIFSELFFNFQLDDECIRKYIISFLKNQNKIKSDAFQKSTKSSWNRSFPKSSEKFLNYIFSQIKFYILLEAKELTRGNK
jgi:hypothetical protein